MKSPSHLTLRRAGIRRDSPHRRVLGLGITAAMALATAARAQPIGDWYATMTNFNGARMARVSGGVLTMYPADHPYEGPIAVSGDVRTTSFYTNASGGQYTLGCASLNTPYTHPSTLGSTSDGTTDGTWNYTVEVLTGDVYKLDRLWQNPVYMFNVGVSSQGGITYDCATNTLWVANEGGCRPSGQCGTFGSVTQYTLSGTPLFSTVFNYGSGEMGNLAIDVDGTFWTELRTGLGVNTMFHFASNGTPLTGYTISMGGMDRTVGAEIACAPVCPPSQRVTLVYDAGREDNFAAPVDPTTPPTGATYFGFDVATPNHLVAHTFKNLPSGIQSAQLTIKMRALCDNSTNDTLGLGMPTLWATTIANLPSLAPWNCPQETTLTIDLAALPGGVNLIPSLNTLHKLDMIVQDDTMIDYAKLTITVCPCNGPYRLLRAGLTDNFSPLPVDPPPFLRPPMAALRTTPPFLWNGFDSNQPDRGVGHSFSVPPGVVGAHLIVRAQPIPFSGSNNDGISFELKNPGAPAAFYRSFNYNLLPAAAGTWLATSNPPTSFFWDLGTTPPSDFSRPNFLGSMADGFFDVYSQDDTNIDSMYLKVWTCPPPKFKRGIPLAPVGQAILDVSDSAVRVSNLGSTGNDGVRLDIPGSDGFIVNLPANRSDWLPDGSTFRVAVASGDAPREMTDVHEAANVFVRMLEGWSFCSADFPDSVDAGTNVRVDFDDVQVLTTYLPAGASVSAQGRAAPRRITYVPLPSAAAGEPASDAAIVDFGNYIQFRLSNGETAIGNRLTFISPTPGHSRIAYAVVGGENVGFVDIEDFATIQFGHTHSALGGATIETSDGALTAANIGGTGQDGVEIALNHAVLADLQLSASSGDSDEWPDGASLTLQIFDNGLVGESRIQKLDSHRHQITADFSSIGSSTFLVQVLNAGQVVGQAAHQGPPIKEIPPCPPECLRGINPIGTSIAVEELNGQPTPSVRWNWPSTVRFTLSSGLTLEGDEIRLLPENASTPIGDFSLLRLLAAGLDTLTLTGEHSQPAQPGNPCIADFNQDGGVDGADVEVFFDAWGAGQSSADVNQDGGIDGADAEAFFAAWQTGSC